MMITLERLTKTYETPAGAFAALRDINLEIPRRRVRRDRRKIRERQITLLNMLGGIDRPTSGSVTVGGTALRAALRTSSPPGGAARWIRLPVLPGSSRR
jgi:ABC-type Fe3+/spermidine/putrescine transport system ATPase subunit